MKVAKFYKMRNGCLVAMSDSVEKFFQIFYPPPELYHIDAGSLQSIFTDWELSGKG